MKADIQVSPSRFAASSKSEKRLSNMPHRRTSDLERVRASLRVLRARIAPPESRRMEQQRVDFDHIPMPRMRADVCRRFALKGAELTIKNLGKTWAKN